MFGVVLHTLVNLYVPASLDYGDNSVQEVINVQDAIELNATRSLVNANNYALYAACEFWWLRFFGSFLFGLGPPSSSLCPFLFVIEERFLGLLYLTLGF